jgi:uncharacterized protein DUF4157
MAEHGDRDQTRAEAPDDAPIGQRTAVAELQRPTTATGMAIPAQPTIGSTTLTGTIPGGTTFEREAGAARYWLGVARGASSLTDRMIAQSELRNALDKAGRLLLRVGPERRDGADRELAELQSAAQALLTTPKPTSAPTLPEPVQVALTSEAGTPLPQPERWSARVGADVAHAKLVATPAANAAAAALGTKAFTVGDRVFLGSGVDATTAGGGILAHELTHVAQQRGATEPSELTITPAHDAREDAAQREDATQHTGSELSISMYGEGGSVPWFTYLEGVGLSPELHAMWDQLQVIKKGPFGKYLANMDGYDTTLRKTLLDDRTVKPQLGSLIAPEPLGPLVDRARAMDYKQPDPNKPAVKSDVGPNKADEMAVIVEISNALSRHYRESVARMFPRVTALIVARNPTHPDNQFVPWMDLPEADVAVSHPMDVIVRKALLAGKFDMQRAGASAILSHDVSAEIGDALTQDENPATVTFAPEGRLWHWVKAEPPNATKEQVAKTLFGKQEEAYRLIPMPPLFGFRARDAATGLTPKMYDRLGTLVDQQRNNPDPKLRPTVDIADAVDMNPYEPDIDPVSELVNARGDNFGLDRHKQKTGKPAPGKPGEKHDEANIVQILNGMLDNVADLKKLIPLFHASSDTLKEAEGRWRKRRDEAATGCLADPETAYGFADTQRDLLKRITFGVSDAFSRLAAHGGAVASPEIREPLDEMAGAYIDAVGAIELPELTTPRLAQADKLAHNIDIAIQEASLHERLGELYAEFQESSTKSDPLVNPMDQSRQLEALNMQLAQARVDMEVAPVQTQATIDALKPKVDTLGFEIGLSEKLARLNMLWAAIEHEDDIWESVGDEQAGDLLKKQNRDLYKEFKEKVYDKYKEAEAKNDVTGKQNAQKAYNEILTGKLMREHGETVRKFLEKVAKHKKWAKFIASLAITFVAFGLGQWEFGAVMAAEGTLFEAAVAGGLVTTTTTVVLNKIVFDQNPTAVNVLTSFAFNVGTFFVIGKLALAAKAAAAEASVAEGTMQAKNVADVTATMGLGDKVAEYAYGLAKEAVVAEAMGFGQAQIEKAIEKRELLSAEEAEDIFVQSLVGVVGMRVFHAMSPSDLFQYKTPEQKLAGELTWLKSEQGALQARAKEISDAAKADPRAKPDKAGILEVLERWRKYLEREEKARQKMLEYAQKHPSKFSAEDIAHLKAAGTDPQLLRQMQSAQAMIAVEAEGVNRFSCAAGMLDVVIQQHRSVGNEITKVATDPQTGQRTITIKPADGSPPFEITEKVPPKGKRTQANVSVGRRRHFEAWLDGREPSHPAGQKELRDLYLRDQEAAINYASEKYGYKGEELANPLDRPMLVTPDAPGEAAKVPKEPTVTLGDHQLAAKLGHGVVAIGNGRFMASAHELSDMHAAKAKEGGKPGKIIYDPESNTSHFEMEVEGQKVRVEAQLAEKVHSFQGMASVENRVVGGKINEAVGFEILHGLVKGEHEMLAATGIGGEPVKPGEAIEFGLGRLHDGKYVIVIGKAAEIDWSAMPGIEPAAHIHPNYQGTNLLIGTHGRAVPMVELLDASWLRHTMRHVIFPSGADFVTMAQLGINGHRVVTPFIVENGVVRKPVAGEEHLPLLEFTIGDTQYVGRMPTGERVFESTLEGKTGTDTPISKRKVWAIEGKTETTPQGGTHQADSFVELAEPAGLIRDAAPTTGKGPATTKTALSPAMQALAAKHGDDAVRWALGTGDEGEAAKLLAVKPPLIDLLKTIPAADARDLRATVPDSELTTALTTPLTSGTVTATQLARLRIQLGEVGAREMIGSAARAPSPKAPLERVVRIADNVVDANARLTAMPLNPDTLMLDSNARSAIEDCMRGQNKHGAPLPEFQNLDSNYQAAINAIRAERGETPLPPNQKLPMTYSDIVGSKTVADLRTPQVAGAEAIAGEKKAVADAKPDPLSKVLPHLRGIAPDRTHADYQAALQALAAKDVGGPTGGPDRVIVADALLAAAPGETPTFVSVDEKIYIRLARFFADPAITWPRLTPDPPFTEKIKTAQQSGRSVGDGWFTVKIAGRTMRVRYR